MTRKAIDELGAAAARDRIARAIGVQRDAVGFVWRDERVQFVTLTRRGEKPRALNPSEIQAIAAAGVLLGANGWEIEAEPVIKPGDLFRSKKTGVTWTANRYLVTDALWAIRGSNGGTLYERKRDLLDPERWERVTAEPAKTEKPTGTIIGERSPASTALRRLVLRALNRAEDGGMIDPLVYPGAAAHLSDLCDDFVSELRAELAPKPAPSPRTDDGALTAYLLEHYPEEWRTDDTAETLAIRLLGETQAIVDSAHEEAEASDANAKEMALELAKVRAELNAANSRAAEAEHDRDEARKVLLIEAKERDEARRAQRSATRERDEARADAVALRGMIRGIAAKAGVPHG